MNARRIAALAALAMVGCKAGRNPLAEPPETQLSLYTSSIGLADWPSATFASDFVYIDGFDTTRTDDPFFAGAFTAYPVDPSQNPFYQRVEYMRASAGAHRFRFANPDHGIVVDTTRLLAADAKTVLYLTDSLETHYRVVTVDESTPGPANATRVRVLQFSPDAGPVSAYVVSDTGALLWSNLPQQVTYGTVTPYITLDSSLVASDGNVYLKFFAGTDTALTIAAATVPFIAGRSYHVVIEGLVSAESLPYPATTVSANPSITAQVRATY